LFIFGGEEMKRGIKSLTFEMAKPGFFSAGPKNINGGDLLIQ
jgi:hypothetical protein